jgi:hemoglobin-like flavoprotein
MAIVIRAHFDGKVIVPDEPLDLPVGEPLVAEIRNASASEARRRVLEAWEAFTANPVADVHISDESLRREHLYEPPRGL